MIGIDELFDIGLESNGEAKFEREFEIYGRLTDLDVLKSADRSEMQEQWSLLIDKTDKNAAWGTIRVRSINNGEQYILTTKVKHDHGAEEVEEPTSVDRFEQFRKLSDNGLKKIRYFYKVTEDLTFEVDVFLDANDDPCPWIKIDLELPDGFDIDQLPELPFDLQDVRVIKPGKKNDEDLAYVRKLFDEFFTLKNLYL